MLLRYCTIDLLRYCNNGLLHYYFIARWAIWMFAVVWIVRVVPMVILTIFTTPMILSICFHIILLLLYMELLNYCSIAIRRLRGIALLRICLSAVRVSGIVAVGSLCIIAIVNYCLIEMLQYSTETLLRYCNNALVRLMISLARKVNSSRDWLADGME